MERLEKINNDFATLFREGQRLLQEGCGDVMNRHREEAFQRFEALGGIPYKTEDYLYADTLPVFDRDYRVVLKYIKQEVEVGEIFKCHVPNLDTNLILTINGWFVQENVVPEIPEGVVICSMAEASVKYKELFERHYNQYTKPADADGLVALNTAFAQGTWLSWDVMLRRLFWFATTRFPMIAFYRIIPRKWLSGRMRLLNTTMFRINISRLPR